MIRLGLKKNNKKKIIFPNGCRILWDSVPDGMCLFATVLSLHFQKLGLLTYDGNRERFMPGVGVVTFYE